MRKQSVRQFSLLGLALMVVSAITSAFTTSTSFYFQLNSANNGTLRPFSGGNGASMMISSCITSVQPFANCHKTDYGPGLLGTRTGVATVYVNQLGQRFTTQGNTSMSIPNNGIDTTSVLTPV